MEVRVVEVKVFGWLISSEASPFGLLFTCLHVVLISSYYKDISYFGLGHANIIYFYLNHFKGPISKCSYILRYFII